MSVDSDSPPLLSLTADSIRQIVAARNAAARAFEVNSQKLAAIAILADEPTKAFLESLGAVPPTSAPAIPREKRAAAPHKVDSPVARRHAWIEKTINEADRGLTAQELHERAGVEPPLGDGLERSFEQFRKMLVQAARRGRVKTRNGVFTTTALAQRLLSGEVTTSHMPGRSRQERFSEAVMKSLLKDGPAKASVLISRLLGDDELRVEIEARPAYLHNVFSRLHLDGALVRIAGVYHLPEQAKGLSDVQERGAPPSDLRGSLHPDDGGSAMTARDNPDE